MSDEAKFFVQTKRFKDAMTVINGCDAGKFSMVATQIILRMEREDNEVARLTSVLAISSQDLQLIVNVSTYIYEQAAFKNLSAGKLKGHLDEGGMEEAQSTSIAKAWMDNKEPYLSKLRSHSLGAPGTLNRTDWRLQLNLGDQNLSKLKAPNALFNFNMSTAVKGGQTEDITVEFTQQQLEEFYDNLELIQGQLDGLTS